jgi:hypothetical protein
MQIIEDRESYINKFSERENENEYKDDDEEEEELDPGSLEAVFALLRKLLCMGFKCFRY